MAVFITQYYAIYEIYYGNADGVRFLCASEFPLQFHIFTASVAAANGRQPGNELISKLHNFEMKCIYFRGKWMAKPCVFSQRDALALLPFSLCGGALWVVTIQNYMKWRQIPANGFLNPKQWKRVRCRKFSAASSSFGCQCHSNCMLHFDAFWRKHHTCETVPRHLVPHLFDAFIIFTVAVRQRMTMTSVIFAAFSVAKYSVRVALSEGFFGNAQCARVYFNGN